MKTKMNIKNITAIAALVIMSFVFLNMSFAANTIETETPTEETTTTTTEEKNETEEVENTEEATTEENAQDENTEEVQQTEESTEPEQQETQIQNGKYFIADNIKLKVVPLITATSTQEIQKNQEVNVEKVINGWAYIEEATTGTKGWIRTEKLKTEEQKQADDQAADEAAKAAAEEADKNAPAIKKVYVQPEKVNLRKENSTESETIGKLPQNTEVEVISEDSKWSKCRVNGMIGFISTQYLGNKKVETTSRASKAREVTADTQLHDVAASGTGAEIAAFARSLVGKSYVSGGVGPNAFDCSGLTMYVFGHFGISLPHYSESQRNYGRAVDRSELAPGDLVCYRGHVAIYIGGGQVVHAGSSKTGVCITTVDRAKSGAYICSRRLV